VREKIALRIKIKIKTVNSLLLTIP